MKYLDLKIQYENLSTEIDESIRRVINSTSFIGGEEVTKFTEEFKSVFGGDNFLPCANGTDALLIALKAAQINAGDEVITTASSWISTSEVISLLGATPVFVDIDEFNTIDVDLIESRITSKTRAIIPVHLYGQMCDMKAIMNIASRHDLIVIEDCAQAHLSSFNGVNSGLRGDYGTFSFYPGKNLGAYGDAGGILVKSKADYDYCKMFANHGMLDVRHVHHIIGLNSRLDGLQAAILRVKLNYIEEWTDKRIAIAERYSKGLSDCFGLETPKVRGSSVHSFHIYAVKTKYRNELATYLAVKGVPTSIHYPYPIPLMPCYSEFGYTSKDFPRAFELSQNQLSLPIYPEMHFRDVDEVIFHIQNFFNEHINNF